MTEISVIVPSWNTREHLRGCLDALKVGLTLSSEVIVVDNGSRDGSPRLVTEQYPHVRLVRNAENRGTACARNQGLAKARGAYALFLDADARVLPGAIKAMHGFLEANLRYGAVAPRLVDVDGATLYSIQRFPGWLTPLFVGSPLERLWPRNFEARRYLAMDHDYSVDGDVDAPAATCILMRRRALKREAPFDESLNLYFGDVDLCARLRALNWRIGYLANARVVHDGGASARQHPRLSEEWHRDRLVYHRKHHGRAGGWWVKACVTASIAEHCVRELYRRAEGFPEEPLAPLVQEHALFLKH